MFSKAGVIKLYLFFYTGLLPFIPIKETHFEVFLPEIYLDIAPSLQQSMVKMPELLVCLQNNESTSFDQSSE